MVKNAIAMMTASILLLLLLVYFVNGFIAPTYVRGQLYLYEKDEDEAIALTSINVWLNGTKTTPNDDGWFTIPVPNAGIPQKLRLEVENPGKRRERFEYSWTGPIPLWNAFRPMDYVFEVRPYRKTGERLKRRESAALASGNALYAYAQPSKTRPPSRAPLPPLQYPQQRTTSRWTPPIGSRRASNGVGEFTYEYGFAVNSFVVYSTRIFRSSTRIYFGMFAGERQIDEWQLSIPPDQDFWEPLLSQGRGGVRGRFPARSNPESWLPAYPGQTMRYAGIVCRLTDWANVKASPDVLIVEPRAPLGLAVWDESGQMLGRFPVADLLRLHFNGPAHLREFLKGPSEGGTQQMEPLGSLKAENIQVSIAPVWISRPLASRQ